MLVLREAVLVELGLLGEEGGVDAGDFLDKVGVLFQLCPIREEINILRHLVILPSR